MNAIDIIGRSMAMHPTLFLECLQSRAGEDACYAASRDNPRIRESVMASHHATSRAIAVVDCGAADDFAADMGAGIIALNVACKLQCLPPHIRTSAAIETWPG
jgi:hypothetical protein